MAVGLRSGSLMCPADSHQDRAADDHAEHGRHGTEAIMQ